MNPRNTRTVATADGAWLDGRGRSIQAAARINRAAAAATDQREPRFAGFLAEVSGAFSGGVHGVCGDADMRTLNAYSISGLAGPDRPQRNFV
jgi:hypothetical protein